MVTPETFFGTFAVFNTMWLPGRRDVRWVSNNDES